MKKMPSRTLLVYGETEIETVIFAWYEGTYWFSRLPSQNPTNLVLKQQKCVLSQSQRLGVQYQGVDRFGFSQGFAPQLEDAVSPRGLSTAHASLGSSVSQVPLPRRTSVRLD